MGEVITVENTEECAQLSSLQNITFRDDEGMSCSLSRVWLKVSRQAKLLLLGRLKILPVLANCGEFHLVPQKTITWSSIYQTT